MAGPFNFLPLGGGLFLGWTLGANDASNCFGTAVGAGIIKLHRAVAVCALMVVIGAVAQGGAGMRTLSGITDQTIATAALVSICAAVTGTAMTFLRLPISTSQAVVGAILGVGLATGHVEYGSLLKVVICWIGTPVGALVISVVVYRVFALVLRVVPISILSRDKFLWAGLFLVGGYGSYALGANNVANTTGMFSGLIDGVNDSQLAVIGGLAIALGVLTYSHRVIRHVGTGIMRLDAYTAFVAVLGMSITVHIFAVVGVPVSTSQAIVGAIMGVGLQRGVRGIKFRALRNIALGWLFTPMLALILAAAGYAIFL